MSLNLIISFDFNFQSFMEFHSVFQIHRAARDLAQLGGHHKIVELFSHANRN